MARSIQIQVEPSILKYGRYLSGYTIKDASKKLKIPEDKIRKLEEERGSLTLVQVKKMAEVYKVPMVYFLLQKAPQDAVVPKDFRIVFSSETDSFSHEVMTAVRKGRYAQSIIQDLQEEEIKYPFKTVEITDDPEKVGVYFLSLLSVNPDEKRKWSNPATALRGWKDAIERLGIFVLQQSLPKDDISAFCLADEKPYVVVINSAEHENRRIFSLFHELGHILLHRSGVCTPNNFSRNSYDYIKVEKFCNQFSASVLVPISDFKSNDIVNKLSRINFENWDLEDIKNLAITFRVSQEVIYRRLVQIGVLDEKKYERKRNELMKGFQEYKEIKKKSAPIPQYRKIISKNGRAFTSLVLRSMNENRITLADVSNFLGTTSKHISEIEAHI
jgi:Zn-dependent peptidase ImmA (M78 family)/transcriptional regulator with XRE-family HTH domain